MRTIRNIAMPGPAGSPVAAGCGDVRCGCGSLLARVVGGEVELKCRRCKHVWRLPLDMTGADLGPARAARLHPEQGR